MSPFDEDYQPDKCLTSSNTVEQKNKVKVAFVRLGSNLTMVTSHNSDGSVSVSLVSDGEIGAEAKAGLKGKLEVGDLNLSPALEASAGGALQGKASQTWDFASEEEAEEFRGELQTRYAEDVASQFTPILGLVKEVRRGLFADDLPDPTTVTVAGGGKVQAGAEAGMDIVGGVKVGGEAGTLLSIATIRNEDGSYDTETAVEVSLKGTASGEIFGAGVGGEKGGTGVIKVRRDAERQPGERHLGGHHVRDLPGRVRPAAQPQGRPRPQEGLQGRHGRRRQGHRRRDDHPRPGHDRQAGRLQRVGELHRLGRRSRQPGLGHPPRRQLGARRQDGTDGRWSVRRRDQRLQQDLDRHLRGRPLRRWRSGAEGNLGIGVGLEVGGSSTDLEATDAAYLGAPGTDGSRRAGPLHRLRELTQTRS